MKEAGATQASGRLGLFSKEEAGPGEQDTEESPPSDRVPLAAAGRTDPRDKSGFRPGRGYCRHPSQTGAWSAITVCVTAVGKLRGSPRQWSHSPSTLQFTGITLTTERAWNNVVI